MRRLAELATMIPLLGVLSACPAVQDSSVVELSLDADQNTETLRFGYVSVGQTKTRRLLIGNTGESSFVVTAVDTGAAGFEVAPEASFPFEVAPGDVEGVEVRFSSSVLGEHARVIEVFVQLPGDPPTIPASATVVAPEMEVSPAILSFGATPLGCSRTLAPIATNRAAGPWSAPLVMESADLVSGSPSFELVAHFLPGEEVWEDFPAFSSVTFSPSEEQGEEVALVRWTSSGVETGTYDLAVSGFGTASPDARVVDTLVQFPVPQGWFPLSLAAQTQPPPIVTVSTDGGDTWTEVSPATYDLSSILGFEAGAAPPPGALIRVEFTPEEC